VAVVGSHPGHPAGSLGILHPFPSVLVSALVAALAALAGGSPQAIATLAIAMLGYQVSIGATNDLVDQPRDALRGSRKPLPAGQVTVGVARSVAIIGGVVGMGLSATLGIQVLAVGVAGYLCGISYDLWLRTRGLAWIAYVAACPLVLVYAWLGAVGTMPPAWPLLLPLAAAVGPALHLSNSLIDVDTDATDPAGGLAARLGRRGSLLVLALLLAIVHGLAWLIVVSPTMRRSAGLDASPGEGTSLAAMGMLLAGVLAVLGVGLSASRVRRRRVAGWVAQALATALLAVAWVASVRS
jgi:4-hydroxybenzoate polyprenyltransferase